MQPLTVVELEVSPQARDGIRHIAIIFQIYFFILDRPPQPLDEDV